MLEEEIRKLTAAVETLTAAMTEGKAPVEEQPAPAEETPAQKVAKKKVSKKKAVKKTPETAEADPAAEVRTVMRRVVDELDRKVAVDILAQFNAATIPQLDPADYPAVIEAANAALGGNGAGAEDDLGL